MVDAVVGDVVAAIVSDAVVVDAIFQDAVDPLSMKYLADVCVRGRKITILWKK